MKPPQGEGAQPPPSINDEGQKNKEGEYQEVQNGDHADLNQQGGKKMTKFNPE